MAGPACSRCWELSSKHGATFQGLRSRLRTRRPGQTEKTECLEDAVTLTWLPLQPEHLLRPFHIPFPWPPQHLAQTSAWEALNSLLTQSVLSRK